MAIGRQASFSGAPEAGFLAVREVCKEYEGRRILRQVSLSLAAGDFLVLFGPNGAGKSTLLGIVSTLISPSSGRVEVGGRDVSQDPERYKRRLGMISHHCLLYDHMTALENLLFYGGLYGVADRRQRAEELLRAVGLHRRRHSPVAGFSRGMRQRLSIARALINDPDLLLLDEPFSGLDQHAAVGLQEQLANLHGRRRTLIMVTHQIERGLALATRVAILAAGRLVFYAPRPQVTAADFKNLYQELVGAPPGASGAEKR